MVLEIFIKCECAADGINFTQDDETGDVYAAMWYYGRHDLSISHKLRWIWQIIKGKPFEDEVVIGYGSLPVLIDHLLAMGVVADKINNKKDKKFIYYEVQYNIIGD